MQRMIKILFLCHGNICRSPMAEFILKKMVRDAGCEDRFEIASAAVSREEIGNDIYPPARQKLREKNVPFDRRSAHLVTEREMRESDLVVIMDSSNERWLHRLFGDRYDSKIRYLMDFAGERRDVSDPWYSGDFERTYQDIVTGCRALLDRLG